MVAGIFGSSKKNWNLLFIEQGCFRDNAAELLLLFPLQCIGNDINCCIIIYFEQYDKMFDLDSIFMGNSRVHTCMQLEWV